MTDRKTCKHSQTLTRNTWKITTNFISARKWQLHFSPSFNANKPKYQVRTKNKLKKFPMAHDSSLLTFKSIRIIASILIMINKSIMNWPFPWINDYLFVLLTEQSIIMCCIFYQIWIFAFVISLPTARMTWKLLFTLATARLHWLAAIIH